MRAPYNPETLSRIRSTHASARDLGWDESFYRAVCQRHGIKLVEPPIPAAAPPPTAIDGVRFDAAAGTVQRGKTSVRLKPYLAHLFELLWRARKTGAYLECSALARHCGVAPKEARNYAARLRHQIAPLDLFISSPAYGWNEGYRLIDRRAGGTAGMAVAPVPAAAANNPPSAAPAAESCVLDLATGEIVRGRAALALPRRQCEMLTAMLHRPPGECVTASELAAERKILKRNVSQIASSLRNSLRRLGIELRGAKGRGGGYCLVDAASGEPAVVAILRRGGGNGAAS